MKKRNIICGIVFVVLVLVITVGVFMSKDQKEAKQDVKPTVVNKSEKSEEGTGEMDFSEIPGFIDGAKGEDEQIVCGIQLPYDVPDTPLTIEKIGQYSGPFVEDGSDEPTANVTALVVTNNSDTMVHFGEIDFQVNGNEKAIFQISTLPAGKSVLVLEKEKRPFDRTDAYTFSDKMYAELKETSMMEDKAKVLAANQELTVENLTEEALGTVYVRYKAAMNDNLYMGGITYSCKIENVGAKETVTAKTQHFNVDTCKVLMVDAIQE